MNAHLVYMTVTCMHPALTLMGVTSAPVRKVSLERGLTAEVSIIYFLNCIHVYQRSFYETYLIILSFSRH